MMIARAIVSVRVYVRENFETACAYACDSRPIRVPRPRQYDKYLSQSKRNNMK